MTTSPGKQQLKRLATLIGQQQSVEDEITDLDEQLKDAKARLQQISTKDIPAHCAEIGMQKFVTDTGFEMSIRPYVQAQDTVEGQKWLIENEYGDIIKDVVSVSFTKGQFEDAKQFMEDCGELGHEPEEKVGVHASTLKAFLKELVGKGAEVPIHLFGDNAFVGTKSHIKRPKE